MSPCSAHLLIDFIGCGVGDFAVLPPHMGALHQQQQQQQQQRSRMLGLMQSPAAEAAVNPTQFPPPAAPRMLFHGAGNTSAAARNLFPNPTESLAPSSDSVYYPRPPVLSAEHFFTDFLLASTLLFLWFETVGCAAGRASGL